MTIAGVVPPLTRVLAPFGADATPVLGAAFFALGAGIVVPRRVALWLAPGRRRTATHETDFDEPVEWAMARASPDRGLYWSVLSVVALIAGVTISLMPLGSAATTAGMHFLWDRFVWSAGPLAMLHLLAALTVVVLPVGLLGMAVSCVHHLGCPRGRWEPGVTAWLLGGAAVGALLTEQASHLGTHPALPMLAAALPAFLLCIVCMGFAQTDRTSPHPRSCETGSDDVPLFSDRHPRLMRFSIVGIGGGAACAVYVWTPLFLERGVPALHFLAAALGALGVGAAIGHALGRASVRSLSAYGLSCAAAGALAASASAVHLSSGGLPFGNFAPLLAIGAVGLAASLGRSLLMMRIGTRSREGAHTTARLCYCAAFTCWLAAPTVVRTFGPRSTLVMLALSLLALGGILIVHDAAIRAPVRRLRLACVFLVISAMMVLASSSRNPWRHSADQRFPALAATTVHRDAP